MSKQPDQSQHHYRLKRRRFLANLLFGGTALTLAGLQQAQAQAQGNPTEGWTIPDLNATDPKPTPTPPPRPPTAGEPLPQPLPPGKPVPPPPHPRGKVAPPRPPQLDGDVGPTLPPEE